MRIHTAMRLIVSLAILVFSTSVPGDQTLSDQDFMSGWTGHLYASNSSLQVSHDAGGYDYQCRNGNSNCSSRGGTFLVSGLPGDALRVDFGHTAPTGSLATAFLEADHLTTSGFEIDSVAFSVDAKCLEHEFMAYYCNSIGLGLRQNGKVYAALVASPDIFGFWSAVIAAPADYDPHQAAGSHPYHHEWKHHAGNGLYALHFREVLANGSLDNGSHPDFASGADITWGIVILASHTNYTDVFRVALVDNLTIEVTGQDDDVAPTVYCNAGVDLSGSDLPATFTATAYDNYSVERVSAAFDGCTKDRDGSSTGCTVTSSGASLVISELGTGKTVHWTATAVDSAGNMTTENCSVGRAASNQGLGNGPEGSDPGNSNQGDSANSNDENGGTPGSPGKKKGKK